MRSDGPHGPKSAWRPDSDQVLVDIADYVCGYDVSSQTAYETAFYCLMDTLACGFEALKYPACVKLLGPVVPGATTNGGARVPGTSYELDPVQAAFNIGAMVRWLDFNDTWLAAEWGHPSDNLGAILAVADYQSRKAIREGRKPLSGFSMPSTPWISCALIIASSTSRMTNGGSPRAARTRLR